MNKSLAYAKFRLIKFVIEKNKESGKPREKILEANNHNAELAQKCLDEFLESEE